ncbi:MAG: hypothetical protein ACE5OZ_07010 [Candidatus Heimdallarchaeota archaeon]
MDDAKTTDLQKMDNFFRQPKLQGQLSSLEKRTSDQSDDYATEVRTLTTCALLAALGVSSSTALLLIPNVEMMIIVIFITGYRYGLRAGISTTFVALILFEMVASALFGWLPLVTLAKIPPYLLTTAVGSLLGHADRPLEKKYDQTEASENISLLLGTIGLLLTLFYDCLTTLAFGVSSVGFDLRALALIYFLGLPFTLLHEISNFIIFLWFPIIMQAMDNVEGTRRAGR